jgi:Ricin-type beta-trefoil lectin domain-like
MQLWDQCGGGCVSQIWKIIDLGSGKYQIILEASGKALDAHSDDIQNDGCRVQLWDCCDNCVSQVWKIYQPGCM